MTNKDYLDMIEFFKERNLIVPSLFEKFADSVVQEPDRARWRVGEPPAVWPFPSPGESGESLPQTGGSYTNFISVGFTWYEPFDDIDGEYSDAVIDLRLVTRGILMDFRVSEGHNVLEGGGNAWNASPDSAWIPFWNEAMRDLNEFATKVDLFGQFEDRSEAFTPEHALCFDPSRHSISNVDFSDGAGTVIESTYLDGPPGLRELLWDNYDDELDGQSGDGDDFFEFLESNGLDEPPYFADFHRFIEHDEKGFGWRLPGGPDISQLEDYLQDSFYKALENPISPQLALNHAGHGINSYGLNVRMQVGAVLFVVQYGWGGGYMDTAQQRAAWNAGMDALHEFFNEIDLNVDIFANPAPREPEVAVRYSEFRGSEARVRNDEGKWVDVDLSRCHLLKDVLDAVLKHQKYTWGLF